MKGTVSVQKALQGSKMEMKELMGGTKEKYSPDKGSLVCPPSKSMIFYKKETEQKELVARPTTGSLDLSRPEGTF